MILVLGASGYAGRAVTRSLTDRGVPVRAYIRDVRSAEAVRTAGADEIALGDLRDLAAVERSARGVDGIFFMGPRFMPEEAALGRAIIDVAVACSVRRFVLSGVYHPTISALVNHQVKAQMEDHLYKTDLEFTVLQPARFMHGLLQSCGQRLVSDGVIADAFAVDVPMAYVDYDDVAEVAAIAFEQERLVRGTFELSAAGEHRLADVAAALSRSVGRPLRAEQVPLDDYAPAATLLANPYSADGFRRLRGYYDSHGFRGGNSLVLTSILGREPTDLISYFTNFLQQHQDASPPR